MRSRKVRWELFVAKLLIAMMVTTTCLPSLMAQSAGTGALTGTVTDSSGALVPNVTVTATNLATGQARTAITSTDGGYRFSLLPPGTYKVKFSAAGFKTVEVSSVTIAVSEIPVLNRRLELGVQSEVVEVTAYSEAIDTVTSTLGTLVGTQAITSLPLTSRNYTQVLSLSAGVSASVNNATVLGKGTAFDMSVNGATPGENNYQMDGVAINSLSTIRNGDDEGKYGGIGIPNPDAIVEFKIQTSTYDASYGRNPGANVNVVTKSGSNQVHGTAFEFLRNSALNANDFFYNRDNPNASTRKQVLDQNQFGGVIGGPIKKDKLFFFGSYQGTRQKNEVDPKGHILAFLPPIPAGDRSAAGFQAALGAANCPASHPGNPNYTILIPFPFANDVACDGSDINPVALQILRLKTANGSYLFPGSGINDYRNVLLTDPARYTGDQALVNSDYMINPKHTLQAKYFYSRDPQTFTLGGNFTALPGEPQSFRYQSTNASLKLTSVLSNTFMNEARISFQYFVTDWTSTPAAGSSPAELGMTPVFPGEQYPPLVNILTGNYALFSALDPSHNRTAQFQYADQIAWSHGKHTIRAGVEYERVQNNSVFPGLDRGWLMFGTFNDFLVGGPGNILNCILCTNGGPTGPVHGFRIPNLGAFTEDDWKVNSRLTLNLGLRWEYFGMPGDNHGNATNIWPSQLQTVPLPPTGPTTSGPGLVGWVVPANYTTRYGNPSLPAGVLKADNNNGLASHVPYSNFAPRFGFAWQPTSTANLVVRGGAGIFYDRVGLDSLLHVSTAAPPYAETLSYGSGSFHTLQDPFSPILSTGTFPSRYFDPSCINFVSQNPRACISRAFNSYLASAFLSPRIHTPLIRQYNLNIQYEFAHKWVLQAGYVGSSGINLLDTLRNFNTANLASPSNPINGETTNSAGNVSLRVPYLGYQPEGLQGTAFDGISNYNSLQLTVRKQFSHGLTMQAAYTWSKSLTDLVPEANDPTTYNTSSNNANNFAQQYGPAAFNRPQRLIVNYHYDLPLGKHNGAAGKLLGGWSVAGVTTAQDGTPITMEDSSGGSIYGTSTNARAQLCPGMTNSSILSHGSIEQRLGGNSGGPGYFVANAFCPAPVVSADGGTDFGNSGVGLVLGPGQFNTDVTVIKDTKLTERQSIEFRTEFYNLFNHPQFINPVNTIGPTQGQIIGTSVNPRIIQFGLKYSF